MLSPASSADARERPRPAKWDDALTGLRERLSSTATDRSSPPDETLGVASRAAAGAHARLLLALEGGRGAPDEAVPDLVGDAARLLGAVADVWAVVGRVTDDRRPALIEALERRLDAHESDVLAGELTYAVSADVAGVPAARARTVIAQLRRQRRAAHGDLLALQVAATDMAALMVRGAGEIAGGADATPACPLGSGRALLPIVTEIAGRAEALVAGGAEVCDVVARQLTAALRVPACGGPLRAGPPNHADALGRMRVAWLALAAHEHAAVTALDEHLSEPTYHRHFATLADAIDRGAVNVLCGARLIGREPAFRHRAAWARQTIALSHALEAYVDGLRGAPGGFVRAQLIVLTRLVRASGAITLIDLQRAGHGPVTEPPVASV
jgi:hypothetical protein